MRRKVREMSRFWFILVVALAGCANTGTSNTPATRDSGQAILDGAIAPTVKVADIDDALAQFMGPEGGSLILLSNRFDRSKLDYSIESLLEIDSWLADVHTINKLQAGTGRAGEILMMDGRGDNSVTFAGLYLGQVIRANSDLNWQWERFDTFLQSNPTFAEHYGLNPGLDTFVLVGPQGVATPINTALKRVISGKEESVHYIGQLLMNEIDLEEALSGQNLLDMDRRDWQG